MSDNENGNNLATFMKAKTNDEGKKSSTIIGSNKTQEALDKNKEKEEDEKNKELDEAKKKASATSNMYKANLVQAQGRQAVMMFPFILVGVVIVITIFLKGGSWIQYILSSFMGALSGSK